MFGTQSYSMRSVFYTSHTAMRSHTPMCSHTPAFSVNFFFKSVSLRVEGGGYFRATFFRQDERGCFLFFLPFWSERVSIQLLLLEIAVLWAAAIALAPGKNSRASSFRQSMRRTNQSDLRSPSREWWVVKHDLSHKHDLRRHGVPLAQCPSADPRFKPNPVLRLIILSTASINLS